MHAFVCLPVYLYMFVCTHCLFYFKGRNFREWKNFAIGKIREIFGINFRELAVFAFLARINFHEFMI